MNTLVEIKPIISPDSFVGLEGKTHLCGAGEAPWLKSHEEVYNTFSRLKGGGRAGKKKIDATGESCRQKLGELWNVSWKNIAFMPSCSEAMSAIARGMEWRAGDNIVTANVEFPSLTYSWRQIQEQGVELRMVPHRDYVIHEEDLLEAVDERTRVLAISHASFYTGQCHNIEKLAEGLRKRGRPLFILDATHSSGILQVPGELTDITMSPSYKYMLSTHGIAPCYFNERAAGMIRATSFGWHNLQIWPEQKAERFPIVDEKPMPERFEAGNVATLQYMFLNNSLGILLETGIERIEQHARTLSGLVASELNKRGFKVISPQAYGARSGNTSIAIDNSEQLHDQLAAKGVHIWGEQGRLRVTTHVYNSSEDVYRFLDAFDEVMRG
ncbi:MAG: aminotransferase class V-fold PLP-dependent enzyme [Chitinophagales bacterium]|nr:aminotransferase class V-fold PLP-dependent enzyme [Chitinophagales bacterium]